MRLCKFCSSVVLQNLFANCFEPQSCSDADLNSDDLAKKRQVFKVETVGGEHSCWISLPYI